MTLDLAHSTALVTGGGRGIGAATCRALAARGCHVLVEPFAAWSRVGAATS